jgi:hypothetical protein
MDLKEIVGKFSGLNIEEIRSSSEESQELVFTNERIEEWNKIFEEILGPPLKPKGVKPTKEDTQITADYGGIFANQTLYKKEFADTTVVAMLWPWQDSVHITLKMILLKK